MASRRCNSPEAALQPVIALLSVVAVFLLAVRDAARDPATAGGPAGECVPASYAAVLCAWRHGEVRAGWTIGEFDYAPGRLGGHQNRRSDPPPGWLVLSRGWTLLRALVQGEEVMQGCRDPAGCRRAAGPPRKMTASPGLRESACTYVIRKTEG